MVKFDEATHTYTNENKRLISVTQLMQKQGLSPDYSNVSKSVLNAKAERGSLIHKEIEEFNKNGSIGFTNEMLEFKKYINENSVDVILSETMIYNDIIAGTADLVTYKQDEYTIADIKTTSTLHKEAVSWQLSIYAYLFNEMHQDTVCKITKGQAYHFDSEGNLNVVDIALKPFDLIEKLIECERKGEKFNPNEIVLINDNSIERLEILEEIIAEIDEQKKKVEEKAKEIRQALLNAMQERGIKTFETSKIRLTIKDAYIRTSIDSTKLKKELPEIAEKYTKASEVKATLLITLKEEQ